MPHGCRIEHWHVKYPREVIERRLPTNTWQKESSLHFQNILPNRSLLLLSKSAFHLMLPDTEITASFGLHFPSYDSLPNCYSRIHSTWGGTSISVRFRC